MQARQFPPRALMRRGARFPADAAMSAGATRRTERAAEATSGSRRRQRRQRCDAHSTRAVSPCAHPQPPPSDSADHRLCPPAPRPFPSSGPHRIAAPASPLPLPRVSRGNRPSPLQSDDEQSQAERRRRSCGIAHTHANATACTRLERRAETPRLSALLSRLPCDAHLPTRTRVHLRSARPLRSQPCPRSESRVVRRSGEYEADPRVIELF